MKTLQDKRRRLFNEVQLTTAANAGSRGEGLHRELYLGGLRGFAKAVVSAKDNASFWRGLPREVYVSLAEEILASADNGSI